MSMAMRLSAPSGFPRLITMFLRQRAFLGSLAALTAIDLALVALTGWVEAADRPDRLGYTLLLAPCVIPAVIGTAMRSRGADMETNVPFPLRWPRLLHLGVLIVLGIGGSAIVVGSWLPRVEHIHQGMYWLRYACVALGIALIGARLFGARLAWLPPMLLVIAVFIAQTRIDPVEPRGYPWWLWVLRRTDDAASWGLTVVLTIAAVWIFAMWGPRPDDPGEA